MLFPWKTRASGLPRKIHSHVFLQFTIRATNSEYLANTRKRDTSANDLLVLSPSLWPEPNSSAAGVRTAALLEYFSDGKKQSLFNNVHFGCGARYKTEARSRDQSHLPEGIAVHHLPPNRSQAIRDSLKSLALSNVSAVIFDRFFAEEAYSFHFHKHKPSVLRILDMQDMHALRTHRQILVEKLDSEIATGIAKGEEVYKMPVGLIDNVLRSIPMAVPRNSCANSNTCPHSTLLRELSSIHRSDLVLVCSPYELRLLREEYGVDRSKLVLAPFFVEMRGGGENGGVSGPSSAPRNSFDSRCDFVALGGFKHAPNVDQVLLLKKEIWPRIRSRLPDAKLHIYGAYPPRRILQLHDVGSGFFVRGYVDDLDEVLHKSRVMLAPLRFGAGIKGKIVDSWRCGCPVVTTRIGSEGMGDSSGEVDGVQWGGVIASDTDAFVRSAVDLYTDKRLWNDARSRGRDLLSEQFDAGRNLDRVASAIENALKERDKRRRTDYTSAMLWHHSNRSTEYFSKWIEQKETGSS